MVDAPFGLESFLIQTVEGLTAFTLPSLSTLKVHLPWFLLAALNLDNVELSAETDLGLPALKFCLPALKFDLQVLKFSLSVLKDLLPVVKSLAPESKVNFDFFAKRPLNDDLQE